MATLRRGVLFVALSAVYGLGLAASARADVVITSPTTNAFQVGITAGGNLFTTSAGTNILGTGFRRASDGYDPILGNTAKTDTFMREYWGVSAGSFHGYVDPSGKGGIGGPGLALLNIAPNPLGPLTSGPGNHSATLSLFLTNGASPVVRIDQSFTFPLQNVLDIHITLSNLTTSALSNLQYRRGIDWDIAPFPGNITNQTVNVPGLSFPVTATTVVDLDNADPTFPYQPQPGSNTGDLAGGLTVNLGTLFPTGDLLGRDSVSFDLFEGLSQLNETPGGLLSDMNKAGANFVIEGIGPGGTNSAAIGVLVGVPEPATVTLLGLGLAGLAGWRWRRRRS
jgi:hypothetical protein